MIIPYPDQIKLAAAGYAVLKEYGMVYLAGEERTGKTLAAILIAEMCQNVDNVLVLTTKKALEDWKKVLVEYESIRNIQATNYHQASSVKGDYDLIILDECHNYLSAFPKVGGIHKKVKKLTWNKPIIYSSATPHAEGLQMLYHQFDLCTWSPWRKYSNFYQWFNKFGKEKYTYVYQRKVKQYDELEDPDKLKASIDHLFVTRTRKEAGHVHEPIDKVHWISLSESAKNSYNELLKHKVLEFKNGDVVVGDTPMKLRTLLHQIEGGGVKITMIDKKKEKKVTVPKVLSNTEKIDYILNTFGDNEDVAIMYHYKSEGLKLPKYFKRAALLQATTFAEGVDLSHIRHLIIYSQDFRTSKHSQRRARQANKNRKEPIIVHFLLVKGAISEQVYEAVSIKKKDFVDSVFERKTI